MEEATRISKAEEHEYEVQDGKPYEAPGTLRWTFEHVESVFWIDNENLASGAEIFSRFLRDSEVKSLLTPFDDE